MASSLQTPVVKEMSNAMTWRQRSSRGRVKRLCPSFEEEETDNTEEEEEDEEEEEEVEVEEEEEEVEVEKDASTLGVNPLEECDVEE